MKFITLKDYVTKRLLIININNIIKISGYYLQFENKEILDGSRIILTNGIEIIVEEEPDILIIDIEEILKIKTND